MTARDVPVMPGGPRRDENGPSLGARLVARVREANAPPPPEQSVGFRIATLCAVVLGVAGCAEVGEISAALAALAIAAIAAGMAYSYARRERPQPWVKVVLAVGVVAIFANFLVQLFHQASAGQLASVEAPLAALFVWIQIAHALDVPARRDLLFSLAASAALMAVASAQAVGSSFGIIVGAWLLSSLAALALSWQHAAAARSRSTAIAVAGGTLGTLALGIGLLAVLPTPEASQSLTLPASISSLLPLSNPAELAGGGANPTEPAHLGRPSAPIGVGGYLGFAGPLDTALRGTLGNQVIMHVRATSPGYFQGMTYDTWNGTSWLESSSESTTRILRGGSPFELPGSIGGSRGPVNIQTFYVDVPMANLLFSTERPITVYFPTRELAIGGNGSVRATVAVTPGTVYTIVSQDSQRSPAVLAADRHSLQPLRARLAADLQLPRRYSSVHELAEQIVTAHHAHTLYQIITALEDWMAHHVRYSTDIPPLLPGQDAVTTFLFRTRVGYCEQISTALAVMLRTLDIPSREAIGYVPGPYNPLTGLYEIQAKDAHAWVQVYFPRIGWQSFDPTAHVPLAPPNPGLALLAMLGHGIGRIPLGPGLAAAALIIAGLVAWRVRRTARQRPRTWPERVAGELEVLGCACGATRAGAEPLSRYSERLSAVLRAAVLSPLPHRRWGRDRFAATGSGSPGALPDEVADRLQEIAGAIERVAYGLQAPTRLERQQIEQQLATVRGALRHEVSRWSLIVARRRSRRS